MPGKVYLVGAGPGDPGLFTLRGKALVERADCIIYDFLANEELLRFARPESEKIFVGKRAGRHTLKQDQINDLMVRKARVKQIVVRLKGGDPFIFGRGGEEAAALAAASVPFEIVPGVSSGYAAPAYAGIPVTHRNLSSGVSFMTGHEDIPEDESAERAGSGSGAQSNETLVFLMGTRNLPRITRRLMAEGRHPSTPAAVIRWGTTPAQEVVVGTLEDIAQRGHDVPPPAITVVGEVVRLREQLLWFEKLPLFGKRVVITRMREQAALFGDLLAERGAQVVEIPAIEIRNPDSWERLDNAVRRLNEFDDLLVTSVNGVRNFLARLKACGRDVRDLKGIKIGAIGPATALEFERSGIRVDYVPEEYRAEGLLEVLAKRDLAGKSFLIPRARLARDLVPRVLSERGARVEVVEAYRVEPPEYQPEDLEALLTPPPSVVTYTSSSTARNFSQLPIPPRVREKLAAAKVASIGPITSATLRELGLKVDIEAEKSTIQGLVEAIEAYFRFQTSTLSHD